MAIIEVNLQNVYQVSEWLCNKHKSARFLVAITGAGISVASGLPLIDDEVLGVSLKDFFAPALLKRDAAQYFDIYRQLLLEWRKAVPNEAHKALADVGAWIVTQNVDGLHRDAGSEHVIELHGNFRELICPSCDHIFASQVVWKTSVPRCVSCNAVLKPGIVLEGEEVRHFSRAVDWVGRAEIVYVIGTALEMHPVRTLPEVAKKNGAEVLWINESAETLLPLLCNR